MQDTKIDAELAADTGEDQEVGATFSGLNLTGMEPGRGAEIPAYSPQSDPEGSPFLFAWERAGCEPAYSYFEWWYPRPMHSTVSDDDDWAVRLVPQQQPSPMSDVHNCSSMGCNYSPTSEDDDVMNVCSGGIG